MVKKRIFFILLVLAFTMVTSLNADTLPLLIFDDFTGDTINSSLWTVNDPDELFSQSDGFLQADSPPNSKYASINSIKTFSGDFEFVLSYKNFSSTAFLAIKGDNAFPAVDLNIMLKSSPNLSVAISRCQDYQGGASGVFISGESSSSGNESTSSTTTSGYLKIQRNGSTINTFYKENSDWIPLGNYSDMPTVDATIAVGITTGANGDYNVDIDAVYYTDSEISTLYFDSDGDGYGDPSSAINVVSQASGYVTTNTDCDDSDANVHPGALDTCGDGIDQNCDGTDKVCYTYPVAMTTDTVYTDKEVKFKSGYKVLTTIDVTKMYSGYDPETMFVGITFQTFGDLNNDNIEDFVLSPSLWIKTTATDDHFNFNVSSSTVFLLSENKTFAKNTGFIEDNIIRVLPREGIIADFNGDGKNDYFSACTGQDSFPFPGEQNILMLSTEYGTLKDVSNTHLPLQDDFSHGVGAADIDGDGDLDIFIVNNGGNGLFDSYFLINDGTGMFTKDDSPSRISQSLIKFQGITSGTNAYYSTARLFDMNGDTFPDLLLATISQDNHEDFTEYYYSRIVYNDGNGSFFSNNVVEFPPGGFGEQTITTDIDPIDINNDGKIDLILSQTSTIGWLWSGQYHQVLINDGSGNFQDETANRIPYQNFKNVDCMPNQTFLTDINSDGFLDIVINTGSELVSGNNIISPTIIYINNGDGTFLPLPNENICSEVGCGNTLVPIDFDKDGDIDLIGLNNKSTGVDVVLFENETFTTSNPATWYYDSDNDGYGDPSISMIAVVKPANYVISNKDCNDYDSTVHPGTVDIPGDGIDKNCNGSDGKSAVNSITIESDLSFKLPDAIYKSLTGDVNLWVDFKFFGDKGGILLWELENLGTTTSAGNPITIESDLSFSFDATYNSISLEADFKFFGDQGSKLLWELESFTVK